MPPSAWVSSPTMSTMRTSSMSGGSRFVAVRMMSGIANASSRGSVLHVDRAGRRAISALTAVRDRAP